MAFIAPLAGAAVGGGLLGEKIHPFRQSAKVLEAA